MMLWLMVYSLAFGDQKTMKTVLKEVLIQDVKQTVQTSNTLLMHLEQNAPLATLQKDFTQLVIAWKKVDTFYLAESLDDDAIDLPRYIDVFHNLKENLHEQMKRVLQSKESLDVALYKNSFKTINALEYVLYAKPFSTRHNDVAKRIVNNMLMRLDEIQEVYENNATRLVSDYKWGNEEIINKLIDSSFKLRDWRVGDIAGLSRKYKGKPDNRRAEYYLSQNSKAAIVSILQVHQKVMDSNAYGFGAMLMNNGVKKEVSLIQKHISKAFNALNYLQNENFEEQKVKQLYKALDELHKAYYISLVNAVGISAKILDADGD